MCGCAKQVIASTVATVKKPLSLATAIVGGTYVSKERQQAREAICDTCTFMCRNMKLEKKCRVCDCIVDGEAGYPRLVTLTAYEETKQYGCKHPDGSRWKARGL
jgi:hypothetical protein